MQGNRDRMAQYQDTDFSVEEKISELNKALLSKHTGHHNLFQFS
jgi:hypothetical protein